MSTNKVTERESQILGDTPVTQARFIANLENGSQEWLELRKTGIGGSDVGTILGFNKWESPYSLWAKRTGLISSEIDPSEAMEWGNRLEPVILDKFADEHPELTLLRDVGTWAHPDREWQLANPDAIFKTQDGEYGIVEVKTAQYEDDWVEGVPAHYEAQVQWYLDVFGYDRAYVIALFHGNRYREIEVRASAIQQEIAQSRAKEFKEMLDESKAPDFDGATATYKAVREAHPEIENTEVELGWLGVQFFELEQEYKAAEAKLNLVRSHIMDAMGKSKRGLVEGNWTFTRSSRSGGAPFLTVKRG